MSSPAAVWRPYDADDEPLFTPGLLTGWDTLDPVERARLTAYLTALVTRRGVVHTAVAFNAVYFGYDLDFGGYVGGPLDLDAFTPIATGESGDALPVGAMVSIVTGSDPLYAEVVYKDGAHPVVGGNGDVPSWLSGAPAGASGPGHVPEVPGPVALTERLVLDFDAFGSAFTATPAKLVRVRQRGRLLTEDGHVLRGAFYPDATAAEASDIDFYADYLLTVARDQLLGGPLPLLLTDDAGDDELAAALRAGLATIGTALASAAALRTWNGYAFTRASLTARLAGDDALGRGDLETVVAGLTRSPTPARSRRFSMPANSTRYTTIGPLLAGLSGSAPLLVGLGYPAAVVHANTVIADHVRARTGPNGALPTGVHLRLDDAWQGGGIWRSTTEPTGEERVDPLSALGLGWDATTPSPLAENGSPPDESPQESSAGNQPTPDPDDGLGPAEMLSIDDSHARWAAPLRLTHLLAGTMPVPARVADLFAAHGLLEEPLRLYLTHDGYDLDADDAVQAVTATGPSPAHLDGISWPLVFFAGLVLECMWPVGGRVVRAVTRLRATAEIVDGVNYEHEFDPRVLTRDTAPGSPARARGQSDEPRTLKLADQVLRAVRQAGLLDPDGVAVFRRDRLASLVIGVGGAAGEATSAELDSVVAGLVTSGVLQVEWVPELDLGGAVSWPRPADTRVGTRLVDVLVWRPLTPTPQPSDTRSGTEPRPGQGGTGSVLRPKQTAATKPVLIGAQESLRPRYVSAYKVASFVRRLPPGRVASEEKNDEYRALTARFGQPRDLPSGYTLVTGHTRHR